MALKTLFPTALGIVALSAFALVATPASAQHIHLDFGHHGYGHHVYDHHYWGHDHFYPQFETRYARYYCEPPVVIRRNHRYPPQRCFDAPPRFNPRFEQPAPRRLPENVPPAVDDDPFDTSRDVPAKQSIPEGLSKLSPADQTAASAQGTCPVTGEALGDHGTPIKVRVRGRDMFVCCEGCVEDLRNNPDRYLRNLDGKTATRGSDGFRARR